MLRAHITHQPLGSDDVPYGTCVRNCITRKCALPVARQLLEPFCRHTSSLQANAALDELVQHAEANSRLVQAARTGGAKLAPADRKRATELLHSVAVSRWEGSFACRQRHAVLESPIPTQSRTSICASRHIRT